MSGWRASQEGSVTHLSPEARGVWALQLIRRPRGTNRWCSLTCPSWDQGCKHPEVACQHPKAWQCWWPPTLSTIYLWLCCSPVAVHISIYWHLFDGYEILSLVLLGQAIVFSPPSPIPTPWPICIIVDDATESTAYYLFIVKGEGAFSHILKFISSIFTTLSILKICKCHIRQGKKSPQTPV